MNEFDNEEKYYNDVIKDICSGVYSIYVYNENIVNKLLKKFPEIMIEKRDFYWVITNNIKPIKRGRGRPRKCNLQNLK